MSRVPVLAGVCALLALSPGPTQAQASSAGSSLLLPLALTGAVVTRPQNGASLAPLTANAPAERGLGLTVGRTSAPLRSYRLHLGSDAPGLFPVTVPNATIARDALAAVPSNSLRYRRPGVTLMVVGVAGVLTGALLNEGVITLVGAGVGLYGLYLYIR